MIMIRCLTVDGVINPTFPAIAIIAKGKTTNLGAALQISFIAIVAMHQQ
jgi:hypothetical protein